MLGDVSLKGLGNFEGVYTTFDFAGGVLRAKYMIIVDGDAAVW
jgi:hypothetical protein